MKCETITLGDTVYPIKCTLDTLEKFQDEFGSLRMYELMLTGQKPDLDEEGNFKYTEDGKVRVIPGIGEPSIKAVRLSLYEMILAGIKAELKEFTNDEHNEDREEIPNYSQSDIDSSIDDFNALAPTLYACFLQCFVGKNEKPTQTKTRKATTKKSR